MSVQIYSKKTNQQVQNLFSAGTTRDQRLDMVEMKANENSMAVQHLNNDLHQRVRDAIQEQSTKQILDEFLASDDELNAKVAQLINERTGVAQAVVDKFNGLIDLLTQGLEFENVDIHSYKMDVNALGESGGSGGGSGLSPLTVVEGGVYRLTHAFGQDMTALRPINISGYGVEDTATMEFSEYDPNRVIVTLDPTKAYPSGFGVGADGSISYSQEYPGDAFPTPTSTIELVITNVDTQAKGKLILANVVWE